MMRRTLVMMTMMRTVIMIILIFANIISMLTSMHAVDAALPLDAIVFHVGAGSYLEHHALQAAFAEGPRTVAYGATDLASPEAFLTELLELGEAL